MLIELIKIFVPGSWALLLAGVIASTTAALARPALSRPALALVLALTTAYAVLSLPWTAHALAERLSPYPSVARPADAGGATALIVLSGDHLASRVEEAVRLQRLIRPRWVLVSGDSDMRDAVVHAGIPRDALIWEHDASTTRQQLVRIRPMLVERGVGRSMLVASAIHIDRAVSAARAAGLDVVPAPASQPHPALANYGLAVVTPNLEALWFSSECIYEYLALIYYRARGWLAPAPERAHT